MVTVLGEVEPSLVSAVGNGNSVSRLGRFYLVLGSITTRGDLVLWKTSYKVQRGLLYARRITDGQATVNFVDKPQRRASDIFLDVSQNPR